ncbi:MAG: STAS domain-containing protein [Candidatus Hinthialibacter antarcticus]|nr:STAS domain-containing protein [Candidatus Hinthialibacter antarcticus]
MQIAEAKQKNICLLSLSGDIESDDVNLFEDKLRELLKRGEKYVVMDFKMVDVVPLSITQPLIRFGNSIRANKGGVILRDLPETFRFVLKIIKISHLFEFKRSG